MSPRSVSEIEAEIEVARTSLAETIDELATRAQPKEIARRQAESAKAALADATMTPDGQLRTERVAGVLTATGIVLILMGLLRRRRG